MNVSQIEQVIKSLGQHQSSVHVEGVRTQGESSQFEGEEWFTIEPEPGLEMRFWADGHTFEAFAFSLVELFSGQELYEGELPYPFSVPMSQQDVKNIFGEPLESSGPIKLPEPVGWIGGRDTYFLDQEKIPGVKVVVHYTKDLRLSGLVFKMGSRDRNNNEGEALDIVRMPSKEALERFVLNIYPGLGQSILDQMTDQSASIAIPAAVNRQHGETWGDRNTRQKQMMDASDLRAAVDSNLESLKTALLEGIATEAQFEQIRGSLHALNIDHGWYK